METLFKCYSLYLVKSCSKKQCCNKGKFEAESILGLKSMGS